MRLSRNVGTADRAIRFALVVALAAASIAGLVTGPLLVVVLVVAGILAVTGAVGFCPLYALFGVSSCAYGADPPAYRYP